ncbi:MAG TPA: ornithine carbamoyltransferase [Vicinamibacterales bacterium]|jgi:ornithine carbamoyltransferase|nr:ornithine carbamoyltransferase [Vicinamibacterales bacterium]
MSQPALVAPLLSKDYLSVLDLSRTELEHVIALAAAMKRDRAAGRMGNQPLAGRHVALLFEKPSLRTRTTFMIAVRELGGDTVELPAGDAFGGREALADVARNLERWVSGVVVRTFGHARLAEFAAAAERLHVINALTDEEHPCQALADMLTLSERWGSLSSRTLTYVGDGNNVALSLAQAGVMLGLHLRVASPPGFALPASVVDACRRAAAPGASLELVADPAEAVDGADAVYTDVWTSMGQEQEASARNAAFGTYQVNEALMARARPGALFMHCLPAHRGQEVTDAVIDSPTSVVFDQAENRLHTQKALVALLMG